MLEDCCAGVGARLRSLRRAAPSAVPLMALAVDVAEAAALAAAALPPETSTEAAQHALRILMRLAAAAAPLAATPAHRQAVMTLLTVCLTGAAGVNSRFNTWTTAAPQMSDLVRGVPPRPLPRGTCMARTEASRHAAADAAVGRRNPCDGAV